MQQKQILFCLIILLPGMLSLSGCDKDRKAKQDAALFLQRAEKVTKEKKLASATKEQPIVSYVYEGNALRDPFDRAEGIKSVKRYPDTILSDMSLDSLHVVGTMVGNINSWAIIRGTDGKLYRIRKGMHVGVQHAFVSEIQRQAVIFTIEPEAGSKEKPSNIVMQVQE